MRIWLHQQLIERIRFRHVRFVLLRVMSMRTDRIYAFELEVLPVHSLAQEN
jgi:hypothetical protein